MLRVIASLWRLHGIPPLSSCTYPSQYAEGFIPYAINYIQTLAWSLEEWLEKVCSSHSLEYYAAVQKSNQTLKNAKTVGKEGGREDAQSMLLHLRSKFQKICIFDTLVAKIFRNHLNIFVCDCKKVWKNSHQTVNNGDLKLQRVRNGARQRCEAFTLYASVLPKLFFLQWTSTVL